MQKSPICDSCFFSFLKYRILHEGLIIIREVENSLVEGLSLLVGREQRIPVYFYRQRCDAFCGWIYYPPNSPLREQSIDNSAESVKVKLSLVLWYLI